MHAAGESGLDWRQTVTHRELVMDRQDPGSQDQGSQDPGSQDQGEATADDTGLQAGDKTSFIGESTAGGPSSRAYDTAPDSVRKEYQADGKGQKTTPVQAQEA
jgi:hypothetical protein